MNVPSSLQILATTSADSIHRVTINAANDMLTESELQTVITSLSGSQQPLLPGNLRSSPHSTLLAPDMPPSSSSGQREARSIPMSIEPELVEQGALQNSPTSHGVDIMQEAPSLLVDSRQSFKSLRSSISKSQGSQSTSSFLANTQGGGQNSSSLSASTQGVSQISSQGAGQMSSSLLASTQGGSQNSPSLLASTQGGSQMSSSLLASTQGGGQNSPSLLASTQGGSQISSSLLTSTQGAPLSLLPTTQFQQTGQLETTQLSNMLVETADIGPEQYVVQTTPLMELATSAHTVTINPSATTAVNLTGIVHQGMELQVANSNRLSSELTPINATLQQAATVTVAEASSTMETDTLTS